MNAEPLLPLFVFGTLRRGESNHGYLSGRFDRVQPAVLRGFARTIAGHGFPAIIFDGDGLVEGEVFWLTPAMAAETLGNCDRLEDIQPGLMSGPYYRRARVMVESGGDRLIAWAYVSPETQVDVDHRVILG